jgi:hypothetical protein
MSDKLINRINQFNEIKYPNDNSKRIIVASLKTVTQGYKDTE